MLTRPARDAGVDDRARVRRLELLLAAIEILEGEAALASRVDQVIHLMVGAGLCRAAGVPGIAGGDAPARTGDAAVVAIPLVCDHHDEGTLWLSGPSGVPADLALAHDVAARLARAASAERARRDQIARADELQRSDGLKTALLRGVTHELRTPLSGIAGAAEALTVIEDATERAEIIAAILAETARLERVVSNLLDLSRVEGGVLAARMQWCVAEELVGAGIQASATSLADVDVRTEIAEDAPLVSADPVLTERILTNLLHNAVRHGAPPVTVAVRCVPGAVELVVSDSGGDVDPEVLPSVFEPFIHREGVGLGLGLPLCRRLAEAQGARLEHRPAPGGGASFVIAFPLRRAPRVAS